MDSAKALDIPINAVTHIQNTAPSPPKAIAVATPPMLPTPTRLARPVVNAWKGVNELPSTARPNHISRRLAGNKRSCTNPVVMVKNRPVPSKIIIVASHKGPSRCATIQVSTSSNIFENSNSIIIPQAINNLIVWVFNEKARFFNNFSKEKKYKQEKI